MVTIDYFGVEVDGDDDARHVMQILEQIEMDCQGDGVNGDSCDPHEYYGEYDEGGF